MSRPRSEWAKPHALRLAWLSPLFEHIILAGSTRYRIDAVCLVGCVVSFGKCSVALDKEYEWCL